jgi:hypothetical protein
MNINDFLGKIISMFLVVYYTLILVLRSWKLLVASLVMGWLLVIVNGVSTIMLICLITMIILMIMRILVLFIPFGIGYLISLGMIFPIVMFGGGFLVFLVLFCITLFIYAKFVEFLDRIMSY